MALESASNSGTESNTGQRWESLVQQLREADDVGRIKELVIQLEEAIFNRQQELALNADRTDKRKLELEERRLREGLNLMLEKKVKKLGFPDIR